MNAVVSVHQCQNGKKSAIENNAFVRIELSHFTDIFISFVLTCQENILNIDR